MKKTIELLRENIEYDLKFSSRARRMRLVIYGDGDLVAVAPDGINPAVVERFIFNNAQWIVGKLKKFKGVRGNFFKKGGRSDYLRYKDQAAAIAKERVNYFNGFYGFKVGNITIRDQKTRWGSCSRRGNLNFNYRIAFLPLRVLDYVIVHELCHLKEFNHSQKFWDLVAKAMPEHAKIRKELKPGGEA
ncbi:MAG: M48 family metallopeptidase [Candidatus Paceibacterota bacterium]